MVPITGSLDKRSARAGFFRPGPVRSKNKNFVSGPTRSEREIETSAKARRALKQNSKFWFGPGPTNFFPISAGTA